MTAPPKPVAVEARCVRLNAKAENAALLAPMVEKHALSRAASEVMIEVNALGETLREQRLGALEATALLRTVMEEIDVAIFTFDNFYSGNYKEQTGPRNPISPREGIVNSMRTQPEP